MAQSNRLVFLTVGLLHCTWGVGLAAVPSIASVTAIANTVGDLRSSLLAAVLMFTVGAAAMVATVITNVYVAVLLLAAQQYILISSAVSAMICASSGQYADGTPASPAHIFFDQEVYVLIAVVHTIAIWETHIGPLWKQQSHSSL